jgi:hypothetical protein
MKIIKYGNINKVVNRSKCSKCCTIFTFEDNEFKNASLYGDLRLNYIECPICKHNIQSWERILEEDLY